jgi:hypothetical protein
MTAPPATRAPEALPFRIRGIPARPVVDHECDSLNIRWHEKGREIEGDSPREPAVASIPVELTSID